MSPFQVVFGRPPPSVLHYEIDTKDPCSLKELLQQRDQLLKTVKANLTKAQHYMKGQADKKRRDFQFNVGDLVLVKLQPYRQHSVALRKHKKLGLRYFGPFPILEKIGTVAYKVQLPASAKIHPVFHVALLKPFYGKSELPYLPFPLTSSELGPMLSPWKVLDVRVVKRQDKMVWQLLIQWEATEVKDATWEDLQDIKDSYPQFNLEDKVVSDEEGNVTCITNANKGGLKSVRKDRHVANDPNQLGIRHSSRMRKENIRLKDYTLEACRR
ncbi:unnamed protein product [Cuscuta epithymum]|uniref:Tf2-1-like SH3-like domain-containing protein n=1 Tax=Cuscuta epithymum TaxID=186058 RepID=A0AAV0DDL9_9ASTE|nr:unnamed protein product [Cuscuta epithymum]